MHRCVGVGKCRADTTATGGVMCPSYLATRDERDSTRGRSRVLQELANGTLVKDFRSAELAESLDLCLSCKGCSSDCPAGVDMATYKAEVLYQKYRRRLRPAAHYSLGWLPRWARLASHAPGLANAALRNPALAGLAKRLGGIDARRPLPQFAAQSFRAWFAGRPARAGTPVLLWMDTFTDYFSPEVGQAAVRVLEAAGYAVEITGQPVCCGLTWISTGQLDGARTQLRRSLHALEPAVRAGTPIVGLEPSCTAVLRGEIAELLPADPRARQVRAATRTLAELLTETKEWTAPDLTGVRAVAQPHCHHHAVMGWHTDSVLLASAGAKVTAVGGCCGLAGNFGVERGHYDVSAGRRRDRPAARGARRQGRGGASRRVLLPHPARPARPRQRHPPGPAPGQPPGRPQPSRVAAQWPPPGYLSYLIAWTWVVCATRRSSESYRLVWAVTVVRPRCTGTATARTVPLLTGRNMWLVEVIVAVVLPSGSPRNVTSAPTVSASDIRTPPQRDKGIQISGHNRRLPIACSPLRAARSRPPARRRDMR